MLAIVILAAGFFLAGLLSPDDILTMSGIGAVLVLVLVIWGGFAILGGVW